MSLEAYKPVGKSSNKALCTLHNLIFRFNRQACKILELHKFKSAKIYTNDENREIVFQLFTDADSVDLLKIGGSDKCNDRIIAKGLVNSKAWIKSMADISVFNASQRSFEIKKHTKVNAWCIQLMPGFECSVESEEIGTLGDKKGIYRYRNSRNEIIYIGKGIIRDRFQQEPNRREWNIKLVQYSEVDGDEKAYEAEEYWIGQYLKEHGCIPPMNLQKGHNVHNSKDGKAQ